MKLTVLHGDLNRDLPGFNYDRHQPVAELEAPDGDLDAALEFAWTATQNHRGSWSMGLGGDGDESIRLLRPLHVVDGKTYGLRSSQTGDVVVTEDGRWFGVMAIGFAEVTPGSAVNPYAEEDADV